MHLDLVLIIYNNVTITKVEGEHEFASVQLHHTMMGRDGKGSNFSRIQ